MTSLKQSLEPLVDAYDCAMLDLDGVVYIGPAPVPDVPDVLVEVRRRGMRLAFVTNNAARTPAAVAAQLRDLGVEAAAEDVVTSAQAAAREVVKLVSPGANVLVIGGEGLEVSLRELGLRPVRSSGEAPAAVVQGFDRAVDWPQLAEGSYAIRAGVPWVASNLDLTIPTGRGIAPGNGTLVNAVAAAVGRQPDVVAGKPYRPLFDETVRRTGSARPIMVGDRLDTDIEGAVRCGADSLLVMTGVTDVPALCGAGSDQRPAYVSWTIRGLLEPHHRPEPVADGGWQLADWLIAVHDGALLVRRRGDDPDAGLRAIVAAAWDWSDAHPGRNLALPALDEVWQR